MVLDVSKALASPGTEFPFECAAEIPAQDVLGETVTFDEATLTGTFSGLDGGVLLCGRLSATAHGACAICLRPAMAPIDVSFSEMFRKEADIGDSEAFIFEGSKLDLTPLVVTLALVELPMRFLCKEDCRRSGDFGAHSGDSPQEYEQGGVAQRPFEGLRQLLTKDEEV